VTHFDAKHEMEFYGYCVRIQAFEEYGSKILMLPQNTDYASIVGIKHHGKGGENHHYHLVVATQVRDQAFRVRLRKIFDKGKGNEHMSIKTWDGKIDAIAYLFHESPDGPLHIQHEVSDKTIEEARQMNRDVQEKVLIAKEKASWKIEDELFNYYKKSNLMPDIHFICRDIILYALRHDKYVPNDFLLKAMAYKLQFRLIDGDLIVEDEFARSYVARLFRMDYEQERQWLLATPPH